MPEIVQELCDPCHKQGFDHPGTPHLIGRDDEVGVAILCPQCETRYLRPIEFLLSVGSKVAIEADPEPSLPEPGRPRPVGRVAVAIEDGKAECPVCHDRFAKTYLSGHCRSKHGKSLGTARKEAGEPPRQNGRYGEFPCGEPECEYPPFATAQGRGAHRYQVHGIRGTKTHAKGKKATPEQVGLRVLDGASN